MNLLNLKSLEMYIITLICLISTPSIAHAYLDPGTATVVLQAILAFITSLLVTLSIFWHKIKTFFLKILKNKNKNKD